MTDGGSWFRFADMAADDLKESDRWFDALRDQSLQALLIRNAYSVDDIQRVVQRLESREIPFVTTSFPADFNAYFLGINLTNNQPDPRRYFAASRMFGRQLDELFAPSLPPRLRMASILGKLDGGRTYRAAPAPDGEAAYMFATIRAHGRGGHIPPHFDARPVAEGLRAQVSEEVFSYVLTLASPVGGGALEIYDQRREFGEDDRTALGASNGDLRSVKVRVPPGDLVIFDSARFLHRVEPVIGNTIRWTMCSFFAASRRDDDVYCWG